MPILNINIVMSYFKKLNLPGNLLIDSKTIAKLEMSSAPYQLVPPEEILTKELLDIFNSLRLRPKMVVLHGRNDRTSSFENRIIHSDLWFDQTIDDWRKIAIGVNWEIEDSNSKFYWFDVSEEKECWPEKSAPFKNFNGIHYGERRRMGIPSSAKILDQTAIDGPTLVRTDIPHTALYNNLTSNRVGISVRFFEEDYNYSWNDAIEKFQLIIQK